MTARDRGPLPRTRTTDAPGPSRVPGVPGEVRGLIAVAALVLIAWSFAVPVFEGTDEHLHWQYARFLHQQWRLPVSSAFFAEGSSPPLYYAAIAPVAVRTPTPPPLGWMNGRDRFVAPFTPRLQLTADDDQGRYWPIRRARLLSVLMSIMTLAFCARVGFAATGLASTALLVVGLTAFLPQFAYRGSHISNDVLVTTMAAWLTWLIVRIVRKGFTWRIGVLAAVALAGAYLSKINAIALAPPLALAILTEPIAWRRRLAHASVLGVALLLVAPWTIRNVMLYGDPFASAAMHQAVSGMIDERSLWDLHHVTTLPREAFTSFVGHFGYFTVKLPTWVHALYLLFFVGALAGLVPRVRRRSGDVRLIVVLAAIVACAGAVVLRINLQFDQPQGRHLFPALPAVMLLVALGLEGWRAWGADEGRMGPARLTTAGWGVANLLILGLLIVPAYHPPLLPTISEALTIVRPRPVRDLVPVAAPVAAAVAPAAGTVPSAGAGDARWTITGPAPTFAADVRTNTSDALFVIFDIAARAAASDPASRDVSGAFVFTLDSGSEVRLPFDWRADGRRRTLYLTLLKHPGWHGRVTGMRLLPVGEGSAEPGAEGSAEGGAEGGGGGGELLRGGTLTVARVRLAGSIPSHDY